MSSIVYGGLDVHKDTIVSCLVATGTGEIASEQFPNDRTRFERAVRRWSKLGELHLCYEASGAGFVIKRWLDSMGVHCDVIAPSLMPRGAGDRVKTDKRDARKLAMYYAAGVLQPVRVPDEEEETVRALVRLHDELTRDLTRSKNRVMKYLATLGYYYRDGKNWTQRHREWLKSLTLTLTQRLILQTHLEELDNLSGQLQGIDGKINEVAHTERYWPQVQRLLSLKGIALYSAMVLATEIGDARRFPDAPHLMGYFGLVPREDSSGDARRTGRITKAGSSRVRWVLTEAAWNQMSQPGSSVRLKKHWQTQTAEVVAIGKKAEKRLHDKFWKVAMRKDRKTAATAVAREMTGFIWALLTLQAA